MKTNVMHFFAEASKRLKRLLKNLNRAIGLEKKPTKKVDEVSREDYPKLSGLGLISESDERDFQNRRDDVLKVNREITIVTLDGRQLRFNVPIKANRSYGDNYVQWNWKDEQGERKYLTVSLHGIVSYEETIPGKA